ncbi:MAG: transglutaminase family protein [Cytophagaceae bacterium]
MSKHLLFAWLFTSIGFSVFSQKALTDKVNVWELRSAWPEAATAATSSTVNITFSRSVVSDDSTHLYVTQKIHEELICLDNSGGAFVNAVGYDDNSEIKSFNLYDEEGKLNNYQALTSRQTYEENGIFYSDAKIFAYSFPLEKIGARSSYELEKKFNDVKYVTSFYFHENYPTLEKTISFSIPSWMQVELRELNFKGYEISRGIKTDTQTGNKVYSYTLKNIPADKSEPYQPGPTYVLPHILILSKAYTDKQGEEHKLFNSTADLYGWYSSLVKTTGNDRNVLKPLVDKLLTGRESDKDKIETLFYWVQDNIRYIAFEDGIAGFRPASCQKVFSNRYGDCKGMANLLKEMLLLAGYDARLTWLGTKHIAYNYAIPTIAVDNHMICTVILGGRKYFLDPTETYISFGDLAHRIQGREVIIEDGDKFIVERTPDFPKERNKIETHNQIRLQGEQLIGRRKEFYNGEAKTQILRGYNSTKSERKEEALRDFIIGKDKNISIQNMHFSNMEDRSSVLQFDYDFTLKNHVLDVGSEIYVTIDHEQEFKNSELDSTRLKDYVYNYKYYLVKKTELEIPAGYRVTHMPDDMLQVYPDFTFKITFRQDGNKIFYRKEISVDNAVIGKNEFKDWNNTIKELKYIYDDQIELSK